MQDLTVKLIDAGFIYADDSPAAEITAVRVQIAECTLSAYNLCLRALQR
jgi:hypothetical protein